jgi:predicted AlkP superfamily pyrophosphatase or phosphodiesterase
MTSSRVIPVVLASHLVFAPALRAATPPKSSFNSRPRLIVSLVIDQFRADTLPRFQDRLLPARKGSGAPGGLRYLMEKGAYFPYAKYEILQSMTGPGHATILTGSYPYQSGIPANDWYDDFKKDRVYCAEDPDHKTIGAEVEKPHLGTSPRNLNGTTVGDELKNAGFARSQVISIALKDRAAILMGGHRADGAFWMDKSGKRWVSSTFYFPDGKIPNWVEGVNQSLAQGQGSAFSWSAQGPGNGLSLEDPMMLKDGWNQKIGPAFPHNLKKATPESLASPWGVEATLELALAALKAGKLGADSAPDLLAVSFSTHDYVAHAFGPNAREVEEITLAEDRAISELIAAVEKSVPGGLNEVVFTLTADHGGPNNPDWLAKHRVPAGRIDEAALLKRLEGALTKDFGKPTGAEKWIGYAVDFAWYLDPDAAKKSGVKRQKLEEVLRRELFKEPGAAHVITATDITEGRLPSGQHEAQIRRTWYRGRNPSALLIPKPNFMPAEDTSTHLTGYNYDSTVPLILNGKGISAGTRASSAKVVDLAPTLSWLLGITPPALSEGRVLEEALK